MGSYGFKMAQNSLKRLVRAPQAVWDQLWKKSYLTTFGPTSDPLTLPYHMHCARCTTAMGH